MAEQIKASFRAPQWRGFVTVFALVVVLAIAAACGDDEPEPAPPAEPAAAAAAEQADEPAEQADEPAEQAEEPAEQAEEPAEQAEPAEEADEPAAPPAPPTPMEIAADGVTVGEILSVLNEAEVDCVRQGIGPGVVDAAQNVPVTVGVASGPIAAPIFSCVSAENAAPIVTALLVAEVDLSAETADCLVGVLAATPAPHFPVTPEAAGAMLACMTEDEAGRAAAVFGIAEEEPAPEDEAAAEPEEPEAAAEPAAPGGLTVGQILAMLSQSEVACVQAQVGPAINAAQGVMVTTAMASGPLAGPIFGCVSPEGGAQVAAALIAAEVGLSANTAACIGGVLAATPAPHFPVTPQAAGAMLACMTEDEAGRAAAVFGIAEEEPAAESAGSLRDLVLDTSTTGQDLMDGISEAESDCVRAALGAQFYQILLTTPILLATSQPGAAAPLFECLAVENVVTLGVKFLAAQSGGWSAESVGCMIDVGLEHPNTILIGMGMSTGDDAGAAAAAQPYFLDFYACWTVQEKIDYLLDFQEVIDALTTAEHDLIGAIPEADVACIRDALSDAEYDTLLAGTVHEAFDVSDAVAGCMSDDAYVRSFVSITETTTGPLSEETTSCLTEFAREHPHYTVLLNAHAYDPAATDPAVLAEVADDGTRTWECMTPEEIQRAQQTGFSALSG